MGPYNYFDFIWENYAYPDNLSMLGQVSGYRRSRENYSSFHVLYWWIDFEKFVNVMLFNPNWHELWKYEKCSYLALSRSKFYKTHWAWQGVSIELNFHLHSCFEIFDKNSADKIQSKNYKGGKYTLPHAN